MSEVRRRGAKRREGQKSDTGKKRMGVPVFMKTRVTPARERKKEPRSEREGTNWEGKEGELMTGKMLPWGLATMLDAGWLLGKQPGGSDPQLAACIECL